MKKTLLLLLVFSIIFPYTLSAAIPTQGKVTSAVKNGLIIRKKPTSKSDRASWSVKLWKDDVFDIKATSGAWFKTTFKGVTGWVYSGPYVEVISKSDTNDDDSEDQPKVPKLKKSAKKEKIKKMKNNERNYTGNIIDISATTDIDMD